MKMAMAPRNKAIGVSMAKASKASEGGGEHHQPVERSVAQQRRK